MSVPEQYEHAPNRYEYVYNTRIYNIPGPLILRSPYLLLARYLSSSRLPHAFPSPFTTTTGMKYL